MNNLILTAEQDAFLIVVIVLCALVAILIVTAVVIRLIKMRQLDKKAKQSISPESLEFKNNIINALGGNDNIVSCTSEMSRVSIDVVDIEKVEGQKLQELGASGVLLVGNTVKCAFKEDALTICQMIGKSNE